MASFPARNARRSGILVLSRHATRAGGSAAIVFSGGTNTSLTFKNCTFEGTGTYADAVWFRGAGSGGGTQHIENCRVLNYGS